MSIESRQDLAGLQAAGLQAAGLQAAGRVVAATLREVRRLVRPGVTTAELDRAAAAHAEHTIVITAGAPIVVTA